MKVGLGNKITEYFGIKNALLLQKYRNRNPRAIAFQKALIKDLDGNANEFHNALTHFKKLGFSSTSSLLACMKLITAIHKNQAREEELVNFLDSWFKITSRPTSGQWLEISMYFLSMGCFKAAYKARVFSYRNFDNIANKLIYQLNYSDLLTALYFDSGEVNKAKHFAQASSSSIYWRAIFGESTAKSLKEENSTFFNLINKKRVAIIGPLEFSKDYSREIASYDVIVELNALVSKREAVKQKYHGKPDVIYYNNSRLGELKKIDYSDVVHSAKYAVLKTDKHLNKLKDKLPSRVLPSTTTLNWNGSFSMMENTVADLLLFQPAELKIFGVNLYTSFNYDKSYGNAPPDNLKKITLNFTVHDIFTQYMFMHNMYKLGLIKGDDEFEKVLQLGIEGYVERMSDLYPKFLLNNESE